MTLSPMSHERTGVGGGIVSWGDGRTPVWLQSGTGSVACAAPFLAEPGVLTSTPMLIREAAVLPGSALVEYVFSTPAAGEKGMVSEERVLSDQDELRWVKSASGLTWDQLGKVFGVSRRAVHLWAGGGRLNESNAGVLREFAAEVRESGGATPEVVRALLLARGEDGVSVVDRFRRRHVVPQEFAVQGALAPEEKIDAVVEREAVGE